MMKTYIKAVTMGLITGITATLLIGIALDSYLERPMTLGGEFLLPAVLAETAYIGWGAASAYFENVKKEKVYRKGFSEGLKVHTYQIIFPVEDGENEEI